MTTTTVPAGYALDPAWRAERDRLDSLTSLYNQRTLRLCERLGLTAGWDEFRRSGVDEDELLAALRLIGELAARPPAHALLRPLPLRPHHPPRWPPATQSPRRARRSSAEDAEPRLT